MAVQSLYSGRAPRHNANVPNPQPRDIKPQECVRSGAGRAPQASQARLHLRLSERGHDRKNGTVTCVLYHGSEG
jgi:hypothetical protein